MKCALSALELQVLVNGIATLLPTGIRLFFNTIKHNRFSPGEDI